MSRTVLCIDVSGDDAEPMTAAAIERAIDEVRAQLRGETRGIGRTPRSGLAYLDRDDGVAPLVVYWFVIGDHVLFARELLSAIAPSVGAGFG